MRDQLYSIKMDGGDRTAILEQDSTIKTGICEALEKENKVNIAKLAWLSRRDNNKAYGLMIVYPSKLLINSS